MGFGARWGGGLTHSLTHSPTGSGPPTHPPTHPLPVSPSLQVPKLSQNAQAIIRRYASHVRDLPPAAALAALLTQTLPWPTPSLDDYHALLKESEYAAW